METENNVELKDCFNDEKEDLETAATRWISTLNKIIKKCFKRIRIKSERTNEDLDKLFTKKEDLKTKLTQTDDKSPEKEVILKLGI